MSRNYNFNARYFNSYTKAVGELILAWNDFHIVLSMLFATVIKIPNRIVPNTIWNFLETDRRQRDLLKVLVELSVLNYNIPKNLKKEIIWVLDEAQKVENARNNFAHSPIYIEAPGEFMPWYHMGNRRAGNLKGRDLLKEARMYYRRLIKIREYAEKLTDTLDRTQARHPNVKLPKRPSLPNRGESNGKKK